MVEASSMDLLEGKYVLELRNTFRFDSVHGTAHMSV